MGDSSEEEDTRVACKYGENCYQKNPLHHEKYKHPKNMNLQQKQNEDSDESNNEKFQKNTDDDPKKAKIQTKLDRFRYTPKGRTTKTVNTEKPSELQISSDDDSESAFDANHPPKAFKVTHPSDAPSSAKNKEENTEKSKNGDSDSKNREQSTSANVEIKKKNSSTREVEHIISQLFLVDMPEDFYQFYNFCRTLSADNPCLSLKDVDLELVGPYDVLNGKISKVPSGNKEKYLRHWRYFYDPPEFQTILKGSNKDGLHYGYWRDDPNEMPIFVAKNYANTSCKIIPVAPNIFAAVNIHLQEKQKMSNPFDKPKIIKLLQALKNFARDHSIKLENVSFEMNERTRNVITKTFHGAGIVVPYDKKTQLGYRTLIETDSHLLKLLKQIDEDEEAGSKGRSWSKLQEVARMAMIAADECDFGTPLELGHDLFSSGSQAVQPIALDSLSQAYTLLKRKQFLKIAEAHFSDRIKGCDLSVL